MGRGVIAAGHPATAAVGGEILRNGGNAVDAAVAAVLASFAAEPLLTGLGAGGYMLVATPTGEVVVLDFFVEAPGRGGDRSARAELEPIEVSFGDATQVFHIGAAAVGPYGTPAGICAAVARFATRPLSQLAAPAIEMASAGVPLSHTQAYVIKILEGIVTSTPECAAIYAPGGVLLGEGDLIRQPDLALGLEVLGADGAAPFYTGEIAQKVLAALEGKGAMLTAEDLAAYRVIEREPVRMRYRDREVVANPPPSAGGTLIAYALALLERSSGVPSSLALVDTMADAQQERTPQFLDGLDEDGFLDRFMAAKLGSTTHISVLDCDGWAASVTCSNGEGSGIVVPGSGIHLNNMLGEEDLNPEGFHNYPPGRRLPSMMCPMMVLSDGLPELVLGSAGSNRIRSALAQTVVAVVDRGLSIVDAVDAPRVHFEDGVVFVEPGVDVSGLEEAGAEIARFSEPNLFFGGVAAVRRDRETGAFSGAGDPRRGGAAEVVA